MVSSKIAMSNRFYALDTLIGSVAIPAIPKCGQHTLVAAGGIELPFEKLKQFPVRMVFIRHPVDRLVSCYSFFKRIDYVVDADLSGYESFIDWALESDDEHVLPQSACYSMYHFQRRLPLSRMTEILNMLTGKEIYTQNATEHLPVYTDYRLDDIKIRYCDDFVAYEDILCRM
jgi:hypothetical protein